MSVLRWPSGGGRWTVVPSGAALADTGSRSVVGGVSGGVGEGGGHISELSL